MSISIETIRAAIHSNYSPGKILDRGARFEDVLQVLEQLKKIKPVDRYYQQLQSGMTLSDLSEETGKEIATLVYVLQERGYLTPTFPELLTLTVPARVKEAIESIDNFYVLLRQLLDELEEENEPIERVYLGVVDGKQEEGVEISMSALTESDIEKIDRLPSWKRTRIDEEGLFKPKARAILEMLIDRVPELEEFRRPESWAPKTHVTANSEALRATSFSAPAYIGKIVEKLKIPKGFAHIRENNFSAMMRDWLDDFTEEDISLLQEPLAFRAGSNWYADLPGGKDSVVFITKPVVSLTLTEPLFKKLKSLCQKADLPHGKFLAALVLWGTKKQQTDIPGWDEWVEFCEAKGNVDNLEATLKSLAKKGFCNPN